jgi:hypothetical protein
MRFRRACIRSFSGAVSLGLAVPLLAVTAPSAGATPLVPTPTVSEPPAGTHGYPFPNTLEDIDRFGYVQDEVFIEGTARSYVPTAPLADITDGRWDATPTGPTAGYKTRLLIRRPANPAKFNGTVLVEWLNVSAGFDNDSFDSLGAPFMRDGYAYVGVSAQAVGLGFLPTWDPARYSSLVHPGDSYSYDIFSQAAQAIRSGGPAPLGRLTRRVEALVGWGGSQSGSRLFTYVNSVQPTAGLFDGFVPFITNTGAPLSQAPLPTVPVPAGAQAVIRTDTGTPVLYENSESEFIGGARGIHSQPDSAYFRLWEYTGTSHANQPGVEAAIRRLTANGIPAGVFPPCGDPPINDLGVPPVWRAMLRAVHRWVQSGKAPTRAPRVELSIPADPAFPATIVRDPATGLAKGGIRLPDVAAPTRTLTGERPLAALQQFPNCFLFGAVDPWNGDGDAWDGNPALDISLTPEPSLSALYGKESKYVKAVKESAKGLVARGFLLPRDASEIVAAAKTVDIP